MSALPPPSQIKSAGEILLDVYGNWLEANHPEAKDSVLYLVQQELLDYQLSEAITKLKSQHFGLPCKFLEYRREVEEKAEEDRREAEEKAKEDRRKAKVKEFVPQNLHDRVDNIAAVTLQDSKLLRSYLTEIGANIAVETFQRLCDALQILPETRDESADTTEIMHDWLQNFPSAPAVDRLIKHERDLQVEHFPPLKDLFVRESYVDLLKLIHEHGPNRTIAITGDPGVGKSAFSLFVLLALAKNNEPVVHISQGGMAFVYRKGTNKFEHLPAQDVLEWKQKDCWLLLDGRALDVPYLQKKTRGVVFASPQKKNYHEFVKASGLMLYMPPWTWKEVELFANNVSMNDWKKWRCFQANSNSESGESTEPPQKKVKTDEDDSDWDPEDENVAGHNPEDMLKLDHSDSTNILALLKVRYAIVGGRIRLLLSDRYLLTQLRDKVKRSVSHLTPKELGDIESVDIGGFTPSLGYSIQLPPLEYPAKYLDYQLDFCSEVALKGAHHALLRRHQSSQHALFMQTLGNSSAAAMSGHLFEFMCHDLVQRIYTILRHREKLGDPSPYTVHDIRVKLFNLDTHVGVAKNINVEFHLRNPSNSPEYPAKLYEEVKPNQGASSTAATQTDTYKFYLENPVTFRKDVWEMAAHEHPYGTYFQPLERNFADVDALFHNILLQMTVSLKHPFQMSRVKNLVKVAHNQLSEDIKDAPTVPFDFAYVVPDEILEKFSFQVPLTDANQPYKSFCATEADGMQMMAVGIPSNVFFAIWNAS